MCLFLDWTPEKIVRTLSLQYKQTGTLTQNRMTVENLWCNMVRRGAVGCKEQADTCCLWHTANYGLSTDESALIDATNLT